MSYEIYESQIKDVLNDYPNLKIKTQDGKKYLKGILDILDDYGDEIGQFLIEIHYKEGFPYRYPRLYEVGDDIPLEDDWHKNRDNICCITVEADERLKCFRGITIIQFINKYVRSYLANQIYRKRFGEYKNGEYAHYSEGICQFYNELFKSENLDVWKSSIETAFNNRELKRYEPCYCGSGKKYKKCHQETVKELRMLGKEFVINDILKIK